MSVLTRKRLFIAVVASLLVTGAALANNPSPRSEVRMVYDPATANSILFGGRGATDYGTATAYYSNETWIWNGSRWAQRFPAHSPSVRSAAAMAFDTSRSRVVLFGGRDSDTNVLGDTWIYRDNDWTPLSPASSPPARQNATMAYDPIRDRTVLFGGSKLAADGVNFDPLFDMWELDATNNWRQITADGPHVIKPMLTWAGTRLVLMGMDADGKTLMYEYDSASTTWNQVKPKDLPPCANEAALVWMDQEHLLALVGGLCSAAYDTAYYYDGANWYPFNAATGVGYVSAHAMTFDTRRQAITLFGGIEGGPRALTFTYTAGDWHVMHEVIRPEPRALPAFASDPINKAVWMFGGINQYGNNYYDDLWKFQNGNWGLVPVGENAPSGCGSPNMVVDTERAKLVVVCSDSGTYEYDLKDFTWKKFSDLKTSPAARRLAHLAYDPVQKKSVYYGGYDGLNYRNDTWLWDGSAWTEVKKNRADARSNASMWFDPTLQKVVIYGGIGRPQPENTIRRYSDMWSLDGANGWTKMNVTTTPGERYNARVLVDPHTNKLMLFGGVRVDQIDDKTRKQVIAGDLWEWDGKAWTLVQPENIPSARQSYGLGYDAYSDRFVIFGGYNGLFLSDVWTSPNWKSWTPREELLERRRVTRK